MEYILWGYLIVWPIYIYLSHEQEKQSVLDQPEKRVAVYQMSMLHLWLPTIMVFALVFQSELSIHDIGLKWHWGLANQIGVVGLILLSVYFLLSIKQTNNKPESHQALRKQLSFIQWFLPTTVKESRYFILGLSISAGICEELLFRGYLMQLLAGYMPTYATVIISSIAFGLGHSYQGPSHMLRSALMGVVMALIYLATDSIIIPVLLHTIVDMYGGAIAYIVFKKATRETLYENV